MPTSGSGSASSITSSGYPTASDVTTRLTAMGLTVPATGIIEAEINASIAAWEDYTGYNPFLGTGDDETRYLNGEGCIIDFQGGLTAAPTTLIINGTYDDSGVYENGTTLVVNRDFILMPMNALVRGKPYDYCKLTRHVVYERLGSVKIVAPFGYSETVPADVWTAILKDVLVRLTPQLALTESGGAESLKQGPVEWKYGSSGGSFKFSSELMSSEARACALGYRRVRIA